ncbi:hypothetical protein EFB08_18745 [Rufibacter latericius]|uniref:Uncharacterized protein n=2 Tax=Rufibacter latericius TaxID=2487040 RepID=A0A3M9MDE2_9BACT|nr:hypothetical protein EFB08_18745 [Rufibacter latericius]
MTLLLCSFLVASCGNDDEEEVAPLDNQIEYENNRYALTVGLSFDLGPIGFVENSNTHYAQAFIIADTATATQDPNMYLELYLFSSGATAFKTGTFEFADLSNETSEEAAEAKYQGKNFFIESFFYKDANDDQEFDEDTETFSITGGTVTISGTPSNYTIECDVQLENNQGLKAHYSGDIVPISTDPDDDDATAQMRKAPKAMPFKFKTPAFINQ